MRHFFNGFFVTLLLLSSCNLDDGVEDMEFSTEVVPILSVDTPKKLIYSKQNKFSVTYVKPSSCHAFTNFYYNNEENVCTIAVINNVYSNNTCTSDYVEETQTFNFKPYNTDTYIFRFFIGDDSKNSTINDSEDEYLVVEIPVVQE